MANVSGILRHYAEVFCTKMANFVKSQIVISSRRQGTFRGLSSSLGWTVLSVFCAGDRPSSHTIAQAATTWSARIFPHQPLFALFGACGRCVHVRFLHVASGAFALCFEMSMPFVPQYLFLTGATLHCTVCTERTADFRQFHIPLRTSTCATAATVCHTPDTAGA